jgi:hypothetical protein
MSKTKFAAVFKSMRTAVSKHSPEILTGIGIAGMVTTTVLAVKATPKAMRLIEEYEEDILTEDEKIKPIDVVKLTWKCYIPAAITGTASVACLIGASSVNARRNTALATAYKLSETALSEYREKVVETIGEKKEKEVRDAVAKEKIEKSPVQQQTVIFTGRGDTLCYDPLSDRYFKSDIEKIRKAANDLNNRMFDEMDISLNEFYSEIGLKEIGIGSDVGWNINNGDKIDLYFSAQLADDDTPCLVIEFNIPPKYGYR